MAHRSVEIASAVGLHARPAAAFAAAAAAAPVQVTIRKAAGQPVPAASILSLLTLNAACGDEVILEAEGDRAEETLAALAAMLAKRDEEDEGGAQ